MSDTLGTVTQLKTRQIPPKAPNRVYTLHVIIIAIVTHPVKSHQPVRLRLVSVPSDSFPNSSRVFSSLAPRQFLEEVPPVI